MHDRHAHHPDDAGPTTGDGRTPVVLVTGLDAAAVQRVGEALEAAEPYGGTVHVHHDLRHVESGRVIRTLSRRDRDGRRREDVEIIDLAHGCVSCTLREDLLPLLRRLHRSRAFRRIVVSLDPIIEPERVAWAVEHVVVHGGSGDDAPVARDVRITSTIACVREDEWLDCATGDHMLAERVHAPSDDDRTVAQVAVGQVAFADALVVVGCDADQRDAWASARLVAVLKRLAPNAPMMFELPGRKPTPVLVDQLLDAVPAHARRGRIDGPHDPLLAGQPTLEPDCGVSWVEFHCDRPFHPERLHDAMEVLLDGVVCSRGRLWLATQPDEALWLESAGGGLRVAPGGRWLVAMDDRERARTSAERRALGALRWDDTFGDRHSSLVVLVHRADPEDVTEALRHACLNDVEFAAGQSYWSDFDDPFGVSHADPCDDREESTTTVVEALPLFDAED